MRFKIDCVHRDTGQPHSMVLEADSTDEAMLKANDLGWLVSSTQPCESTEPGTRTRRRFNRVIVGGIVAGALLLIISFIVFSTSSNTRSNEYDNVQFMTELADLYADGLLRTESTNEAITLQASADILSVDRVRTNSATHPLAWEWLFRITTTSPTRRYERLNVVQEERIQYVIEVNDDGQPAITALGRWYRIITHDVTPLNKNPPSPLGIESKYTDDATNTIQIVINLLFNELLVLNRGQSSSHSNVDTKSK